MGKVSRKKPADKKGKKTTKAKSVINDAFQKGKKGEKAIKPEVRTVTYEADGQFIKCQINGPDRTKKVDRKVCQAKRDLVKNANCRACDHAFENLAGETEKATALPRESKEALTCFVCQRVFTDPKDPDLVVTAEGEASCLDCLGDVTETEESGPETDKTAPPEPEVKGESFDPTVAEEPEEGDAEGLEESTAVVQKAEELSEIAKGKAHENLVTIPLPAPVTIDDEKDAGEKMLKLRWKSNENMYTMGSILGQVKNRLGHGNFKKWLDEQNMHIRTAQRIMAFTDKCNEAGSLGQYYAFGAPQKKIDLDAGSTASNPAMLKRFSEDVKKRWSKMVIEFGIAPDTEVRVFQQNVSALYQQFVVNSEKIRTSGKTIKADPDPTMPEESK